MNQPWIYMCSPSRCPLPPPSPFYAASLKFKESSIHQWVFTSSLIWQFHPEANIRCWHQQGRVGVRGLKSLGQGSYLALKAPTALQQRDLGRAAQRRRSARQTGRNTSVEGLYSPRGATETFQAGKAHDLNCNNHSSCCCETSVEARASQEVTAENQWDMLGQRNGPGNENFFLPSSVAKRRIYQGLSAEDMFKTVEIRKHQLRDI